MSPRGVLSCLLALVLGSLGACSRGDEQQTVVQLDLRDTIRALGSDDLEVSSRAEERLAAIGAPALPGLAAALRQESEQVRVGVIEVLADMDGKDVSTLLVGALADPAEAVRAEAAFALRAHQGEEVQRALVRALEDPSVDVRRNAALACGSSCRSPAALRLLVQRALVDEAAPVAWAASTTLANLRAAGDETLERTVDAAIEETAPDRLAGSDPLQATRAALLLAAIGDARGTAVLEAAVAEQGDTRRRLKAIYALGQVGGPGAVGVLDDVLGEPGVAVYAYDALRRLAKRGVPGTEAALADYEGPRPPGPLPPPAW